MFNASILQIDVCTLPSLTYLPVSLSTHPWVWAHEPWASHSQSSCLTGMQGDGGRVAPVTNEAHTEMWMQASSTPPPNCRARVIASSEVPVVHSIVLRMTCTMYFSRSLKPFMSLRIIYCLETSDGTGSDTPNAVVNKRIIVMRGHITIPSVMLFCRLWW